MQIDTPAVGKISLHLTASEHNLHLIDLAFVVLPCLGRVRGIASQPEIVEETLQLVGRDILETVVVKLPLYKTGNWKQAFHIVNQFLSVSIKFHECSRHIDVGIVIEIELHGGVALLEEHLVNKQQAVLLIEKIESLVGFSNEMMLAGLTERWVSMSSM